MRVVCSSNVDVKPIRDGATFCLYGSPSAAGVGRVGASIPGAVRRARLAPDPQAWDFLSFGLGVIAADQSVRRSHSPDGWTRVIDLEVSLAAPQNWTPHAQSLAEALRFLTGDIWSVGFTSDGLPPPTPMRRTRRSSAALDGDMVALLSGGADSLVGAIDIVSQGGHPVFVSQVALGDTDRQRRFATAVNPDGAHLQLTHAARPVGPAERSQRARSIAFLAYGLLAASSLPGFGGSVPIKLIVPENGLISMNVPLTNIRVGSLSTRTTHPHFIAMVQRVWDAVGFSVTIENPYQFSTKGELLRGCTRQDLLKKLVFESTSCGRFGRYGYEHCGRCVPCIVRRAAIHDWGVRDTTKYRYATLRSQRAFDDVRSLGMAYLSVQKDGVERWSAGALSALELTDPVPYCQTVERGIDEVGRFLKAMRAL